MVCLDGVTGNFRMPGMNENGECMIDIRAANGGWRYMVNKLQEYLEI